MKLITGFLKFVGINALMASFILLLLDYDDAAIIFIILAVACFAGLLFLQLYKYRLLNNIKKNKPKDE